MLKLEAELEMKSFYEFQSIERVDSLHINKYFIPIKARHSVVTLITWRNEYVATGHQENSLRAKQNGKKLVKKSGNNFTVDIHMSLN